MRSAPFAKSLAVVMVLAACSGGSGDGSTSTRATLGAVISATEPTSTTTTTTLPPLELCDAVESFPQIMPARVVAGVPETADVDFDEFTLIAGAINAIRFDEAGAPVLVMIRGALPPRQFTEDHQVIEILDGIPALVGPIGDGYWASAWAVPPGERCDLYSLIFYPPVDEAEVLEVAASVR